MKRGRHGSGTRVDVLLMCGAVGAPSIATVLAAPSEPVENAYVESFHPVPRGSPAYQGGEEQGAAPGGSDPEATAVKPWYGVHSRFRNECLNEHYFLDLQEAQGLIEAWRVEYNGFRPHSALKDQTPEEFLKRDEKQNQNNSERSLQVV